MEVKEIPQLMLLSLMEESNVFLFFLACRVYAKLWGAHTLAEFYPSNTVALVTSPFSNKRAH